MIKPRLRLYVCASAVAVTLGGSVLTQAAGPREFISNLWNREPGPKKEVTHSFSPFKWLSREKANASAARIRVSDHGRRVVSERPSLLVDPFLNEQRPDTARRTTTARHTPPVSQGVIVRPQTRHRLMTTQTVDRKPATTTHTLRQPSDNVGPTRITDSTSAGSSSRAAAAEQRSLPEVKSAPTSAAGNEKFVSGFDSNFQKLFKEVIEESRQGKANTTTPRLPDKSVADFERSKTAALPEVATTESVQSEKDFADFAQKRSSSAVPDLIQESRSQMDSSLLARRATNGRSPQMPSVGLSVPQQPVPDQAGVAAVSHSDSRHADSAHPTNSDSAFVPQRLPDRVPQTVNQLVVPNSMVPERRLFTTSNDWMNRGDLELQAAADNAPPPDLQPVVRVVPRRRRAGIVIEIDQWSPIQPRVSSNVAPARSVPDTSQFRRLSFEGSDPIGKNGAVQTIGDGSRNSSSENTNAEPSSQSHLMIPSASYSGSSAPSDSGSDSRLDNSSDDMSMMMIPDSRTGQSLDAAELGAALATAPAPPKTNQPVFEWPDESELAAETQAGGYSWGTTMFFLALGGGAIGLFFRRKAQGGAFVMTGTRRNPEIS
ncbi:MAG: hypothetical protein ACKVHE_16680 [Planctomycetales bacterium]|jgi:hypothetical protein